MIDLSYAEISSKDRPTVAPRATVRCQLNAITFPTDLTQPPAQSPRMSILMTPTDWFGRARRLPSFSTAVALVIVGCVAAATPLFAQSASTAEKTPQANLDQTKPPEIGKSLYSRENLVAWCIVPFDSKRRSPEERAAMLERLGFKRFAYDWRAEHVASFDAEMEALKKRGIKLEAFWAPGS